MRRWPSIRVIGSIAILGIISLSFGFIGVW
jgi:hypothetical protein